MAKIEIDGASFGVVSGLDWSTATVQRHSLQGGGYSEMPVACYITAVIQIPNLHSSNFGLAKVVRLTNGGRTLVGYNLVNTGDGVVYGNGLTLVRFEGKEISEE